MKNKMVTVEIVFLLLVAVLLAFGTGLERQQQEISDAVIRLHVKANSNSPEDQAVKLMVRDAVLNFTESWISACESRDEAAYVLESNLSEIRMIANDVLSKAGSSDKAQVSLSRELFGSRYYDTFALPGGYYYSLRVDIGAGEGDNWWCVVYPNICTASATDIDMAVAVMGTDDRLIFPDEAGKYSFRFKTLEIFENILGWIRSGRNGIPTSR